LLADAVQCTWREFVTGLAGHRDSTRFRRVLELAVTAASHDQVPTVVIEQSKNLADFHLPIICRPASTTLFPEQIGASLTTYRDGAAAFAAAGFAGTAK